MGCCNCVNHERENLASEELKCTIENIDEVEKIDCNVDLTFIYSKKASIKEDQEKNNFLSRNNEKITETYEDLCVYTIKLPEILSEASIKSWKNE